MPEAQKPVRLKTLILVFLKIGTIGFGGGVGMLALIRKYIVLDKKWITDDDLATAVALGQMIPGPFVPNYVEYIGYKIRGIKGLFSSVVAFLLPGTLAMIILTALYFYSNQAMAINDIFIYLQPVIIGILCWASYDMGKLYVRELKGIIIALVAIGGGFVRISPIFTILICGALGILFYTKNNRVMSIALPVLLILSVSPFFINPKGMMLLFLLFAQIGLVIFGGGFAAIPFIAKEVTILRPWLTNQELITGIALSQITPGPVALLSTFVGYKVSGILGAVVATIAIFLPSTIILIIILMLHKYFVRSGNNKLGEFVKGFISGIKPAIVGILVSATIMLANNNSVLFSHSIIETTIKFGLVIVSFVLLAFVKMSPALLILIGAGLSFILSRIKIG